MNTLGSHRGKDASAFVTLHKKALFFAACVVAVLGFVAGTRIDDINRSASYLFGAPRSSKVIDLSSVEKTYQYLVENYDGEIETSKLVDGANAGLVKALGDTYTVYLTPDEAKELQDNLDGDIGGGIGAEIGLRNDQPTVVRVLPDNPAQTAGVEKGDQITAVNGESAVDKDVDSVVAKIRGKEGTSVKLKVLRGGQSREFSITRAVVNNPSVRAEVRGQTGVLTVTRFDGDTGSLARKAAESLVARGVSSIILDLRGDGGGYIEGAIDVASLWLDGDVVVSQRKHGKTTNEARAEGSPVFKDIKKTVVLVDEGTASASEIVAGALRDHKKAVLMGQKTFGKGSVQQLIDLGGGAQLKVTVAKWYTPSGHNINQSGLTPDTLVKLTAQDVNKDKDPQLEAALDYLK